MEKYFKLDSKTINKRKNKDKVGQRDVDIQTQIDNSNEQL